MLLAMSYAISSSGMGKVVAGFESTAGPTYMAKLKNLFKLIGKQTMAVYLVCVRVYSAYTAFYPDLLLPPSVQVSIVHDLAKGTGRRGGLKSHAQFNGPSYPSNTQKSKYIISLRQRVENFVTKMLEYAGAYRCVSLHM